MAVAANPLESFIWGAGGAKKTPEQVAREREIAAALMHGGVDYSPVDHWLQGAARAAQAGVGAFKDWRAGNAETAGREAYQGKWDNIFGGAGGSSDPVAAALVGGGSPASIPATADAAALRQGMIDRGLPEHVADGFLLNFQDESGLNPGINEANPLVPGSRGGYGLYQLTGPRRVAYEQYAQQVGVDPSDPNAQLDFMMSELQGPEAGAYEAIMGTQDAGSAAAAIVNQFLRPAEQHRARRVAAYTGGGQTPVQVASIGDASAYAPQQAQLPPIAPAGNAQDAIAQALIEPQAAMPQQVAQAQPMVSQRPAMGSGQPSMQDLMGLASDPWANDSQRSIIQSLLGQQMQQQDPRYQRQLRQGDLDYQRGQLELEALRNPGPSKPVWQGDRWWDVSSGQPTPLTDAPVEPGYRQLSLEEVAQAGLDGQKGWQVAPTGEIKQIGGGGVNVSVGGEGSPGLGKLSTDYGYVSDPETGRPVIDPATGLPTAAAIPGSPAALAAQQAADASSAQQNAGLTSNVDKATTTLATTKSVLDLLDNSDGQPTTGTLSRPFALYSGSPAGKVRSYVSTLQSGVALGAMQALKEASATGATGFGALSEKELSLLISDIGALDPDNTEPEIFRETVQRIEDRSKRVMADIKKNVSPERIQELGLQSLIDTFGGDAPNGNFDYTADEPPQGWGGDAGLWRFMSPEDRALW